MNLKELFTEHPNSVDETYFEHLLYATVKGLTLILLGLIGIIHAIFPFLFVFTVSRAVSKMGKEVDERMFKAQTKRLNSRRKDL